MGQAIQRPQRHGGAVRTNGAMLRDLLPVAVDDAVPGGSARTRWARYGIWLLPVQAVLLGIGALGRHRVLAADPDWRHRPLSLTIAVLGVVGLAAIAGLAAGGRGRWVGVAGLLAGAAGTAVLISAAGTVTVAYPGLARAVVHATLPPEQGRVHAGPVLLGAALLTLGWLLAGVTAIASPALDGSDGSLLMLGAPLVFLGAPVLAMLVTLGAMLLLAAGTGLSATAWRPPRLP